MKIFLFIALFWLPVFCASGYEFNYNRQVQQAYEHYMSLNMEDAATAIRSEINSNPGNLLAVYIADYEDFFGLLFNGNKQQYGELKKNLDKRIDLIDKGAGLSSPWYLYCKSGLYFHWAMVNYRFGDEFKAATHFRKSYLLIKENAKKFPEFEQNQILYGVQQAVLGSIPSNYKWVASLFGMKGDVKQGVSRLVHFINKTEAGEAFRSEAIVYGCYLKFYLLFQQQEVWNFMTSPKFNTTGNLLNSFMKANIAINYKKANEAITVLKEAEQNEHYKKFPLLDYELGSALYHKADQSALFYLQRFLTNYRGQFFIKDSWQKMAQLYYVMNNNTKAEYCKKMIARHGSALIDSDKQAQRFSESNAWPHPAILEARMLTEGGFYQEALLKLASKKASDFVNIADRLEYYFRLGRIYNGLSDREKSIRFYQAAVDLGRNRKEQFGARAALELGLIYEQLGQETEAIKKFEECLAMRDHDFQTNIDQQAKAGLNRIARK